MVAFGLGMATTLALAGMLAWRIGEGVAAWARLHQHRKWARLSSSLPTVAAAGVCAAGAVVITRSVGMF